jgi:integrase
VLPLADAPSWEQRLITKPLPALKELAALCASNGISAPATVDLRIHDLRRTNGSYQAMTGASLPMIGKVLNHKSAQATQVYARLHSDATRDVLEAAISEMDRLGAESASLQKKMNEPVISVAGD